MVFIHLMNLFLGSLILYFVSLFKHISYRLCLNASSFITFHWMVNINWHISVFASLFNMYYCISCLLHHKQGYEILFKKYWYNFFEPNKTLLIILIKMLYMMLVLSNIHSMDKACLILSIYSKLR